MESSQTDPATNRTSRIRRFFSGLRAQHQRDVFVLTGVSGGLIMAAGVTGFMALGPSLVLIAIVAIVGFMVSHFSATRSDDAVNQTHEEEADPNSSLLESAGMLIDAFPDSVILLDRDKRILESNMTAQDVFVPEEVQGKVFGNVLRRPLVVDAVELAMATGERQEVEFTDPVPVERHFLANICPIPGEDDGPIACVLMIRDLTAIKRSERMRADFVANASHELRTPLSSLAGFIETLKGHAKDDPEAQDRFLQIMHEQAGRMRRLIDDLLSLSRIELNEHVAPSGTVDLVSAVSDVVDAAAPLIDKNAIAVNVDASDGGALAVGDRDELIQVVQNLVDNALKYGATNGRIEIEVAQGCPEGIIQSTEGSWSFVQVRDFGVGIAREHIPRLTERFYRVDVKHSRESGGTGLGLAIVKHIVSRHRGRLHIKSEENEGSCFTVVLPAPTEQGDDQSGKIIPIQRALN